MSHNKERKEKFCLNCNAYVQGRFCHICGQENIEAKQTFWHLVTHFVYDVTHFDGKFFSTLQYVLFRPGFLSKEFLRGRRASYLDPIRMYIFTSAIFFIIFFSFVKKGDAFDRNSYVSDNNKDSAIAVLKEAVKNEDDSVTKRILLAQLENLENKKKPKIETKVGMPEEEGIMSFNVDTTKDSSQGDEGLPFIGRRFPSTVAEYDSIQNKRPTNKKDSWVKQRIKKRFISLNEDFKENPKEFYKTLSERFAHAYPQMMFVSLPLAALILQMLYVRRRKQFFYVSHGIFVLHVYIAVYILLLLYYLFSGLYGVSHLGIFHVLDIICGFSIIFYIYKAMRNFYMQGRIKTLLKLFIFSFFYLIVFVFLVSVFFIISVMQI